MRRALALARRGMGHVNPNPMVGAVLVRDDRVIGQGYHACFGESHAEVNALQGLTREETEGATLYVTLEPCSHAGKTPPCSELIAGMGIGRVVAAMTDPNPLVGGNGFRYLRQAGIEVVTGLMEKAALRLNEVFAWYITRKTPYVVLKTAMTMDGKIATVTNASRWITGEPSRRMVHRLRQQLSAVMVGVDTVIFDDPLLNIRLRGMNAHPLKVIADTHARIPLEARVLTNDPQLTLVATTSLADAKKLKTIERMGAQVLVCPMKDNRVDLAWLTEALGSMEIDSVMIEGGSTLAFSALEAGIVNKVISFIAPKILGGAEAPTAVGGAGIRTMEDAIRLSRMSIRRLGDDVVLEATIQ